MELHGLSSLNGPRVHVCIFFSIKRQVYARKVWSNFRTVSNGKKMFGILGHFQAKNLRGKKETKLKKGKRRTQESCVILITLAKGVNASGEREKILVSSGKPDTGKLFTVHLLTPGFVS
ncbi:hypothetical protein H0E87_014589 [Populus deltoides]|uniref:Uncharacterized protein n=1 Tax=Populus deltoides TaxID=3696 RepID=A0A8T2YDX4_POPDE|nr:hypothetical protein H0E87_014589 [Populus deltoides]